MSFNKFQPTSDDPINHTDLEHVFKHPKYIFFNKKTHIHHKSFRS